MGISGGLWRLFLQSDCLKYYPDVFKYTEKLRKEGKDAILQIDNKDVNELNHLLSDEDAHKLPNIIRAEWKFTYEVIDNGRGFTTLCDYCQHQHIRYKYVCKNVKTGSVMYLGSVCVGYVIHGKEKMQDKDFADKFVNDLYGLRGDSKPRSSEIRAEQEDTIRKCMRFIHKAGKGNGDFIHDLARQWSDGKPLSSKQLDVVKQMAKKARDELIRKGVI
jgi:hypothetical protein